MYDGRGVAGIDPQDIPPQVWAWLPERFVLEVPEHGSTADVAFAVGKHDSVALKRCCMPPYTVWLENEYRALEALAESGLPIPRALGLHRTGPFSESAVWLAMTRLPGEPLWNIIARAAEDERVFWFRELARLLAEIHATEVPAALRDSAVPPIDESLGAAASFVRRHEGADARRLSSLLEQGGDVPAATLIHGDFTLDNILADPTGITGVIDWGGACLGDPRWDITLALSTAPQIQLQPAVVQAFFENYHRASLPVSFRRAFWTGDALHE